MSLDIPNSAACYICGASHSRGALSADGYFVCRIHRAGVGPFLKQQCEALRQERDTLREILAHQPHGHDCVYRLDLQTRTSELEQATATADDLRNGIASIIARIRESFRVPPSAEGDDADVAVQLAGYISKLWSSDPRVEALQADRETMKARIENDQATILQQTGEVEGLRTKLAKVSADLGEKLAQERGKVSALDGQLRATHVELAQWKAAFHD